MKQSSREQLFCPNAECGARLPHHHPFCPTQDPQTQIARLKEGYRKFSEGEAHQRKRATDAWREVTFWQGKFAMVKHENNQLRRKLRPTKL